MSISSSAAQKIMVVGRKRDCGGKGKKVKGRMEQEKKEEEKEEDEKKEEEEKKDGK